MKKLKKDIKKERSISYRIEGCTFNAVHWDEDALKTVQTVANALLNLSELFKSQNVTIDSMFKIIDPNINLNSEK